MSPQSTVHSPQSGLRVAKRHRSDGTAWHVTIWAGPGSANRWESRLSTAFGKLPRLLAWLSGRVDDPAAWLAAHVPEIVDRATAPVPPAPGKEWALYGHIAVIRPEHGGYTVDLGIHGGTQSGAGGHWPDVDSAISAARRLGARQIVCAAPGENGGDCSKPWRATHPDGVFKTPKFSDSISATPMSAAPFKTEKYEHQQNTSGPNFD